MASRAFAVFRASGTPPRSVRKMQPLQSKMHLDKKFASKRRNETPQYPTRRAQEPRLAKSAWLAPHSRFVVVKIWKSDWKFLRGQAIAVSREIRFALHSEDRAPSNSRAGLGLR